MADTAGSHGTPFDRDPVEPIAHIVRQVDDLAVCDGGEAAHIDCWAIAEYALRVAMAQGRANMTDREAFRTRQALEIVSNLLA